MDNDIYWNIVFENFTAVGTFATKEKKEEYNHPIKNMTLFLDEILEEVTTVLDQGLGLDPINAKIRDIFEAKASQTHSIFHTIKQENLNKFWLLLGFCYQLGIGVDK